MKKVLALVFVGSLALTSCSEKSENALQDSNVMLQEPEKKVVETQTVTTDTTTETTPIKVDSTQTK